MGEAILYNRRAMGIADYDWNAAFNNPEFIKKISKIIPPGPYTNYQLSILDYEYQEQNEMTAGYFPSCYQRIGSYAFEKCSALSLLSFSSSRYDTNEYGSIIIYDVGENAFANCPSLRYVGMSAIRKIGKRAFYNCVSLSQFYGISYSYGSPSMGYWMYSIDDEAFANCTFSYGIAIYYMSYVDRIGKSAFKNIKSRFITPGNYICKEIDDYAFENCVNLSEVVKNGQASDPYCRCSIGKYIFEGCTNLSYIEIRGGYDIYSDTFGDLHTCLKTIYFGPSYNLSMAVNQYSLSNTIGSHAFENYSLLSGVYISWINKIEEYAFANCHNLSGYTNIGYCQCAEIDDYAFYNCSNLSYMNVNTNAFSFTPPLKLSLNGSNIFKNCSSLSNLNLLGCVNIPSYLFKSCNGTRISTITIGGMWSNIGNYGYYMSANVGKEAFAFCSTLSYVYGSLANRIEESAFYMCENILYFYLGTYLCSEIQSNAFYGCSNISMLSFNTSCFYMQSGSSVALSIGNSAFANCYLLSYVNLNNVRYLGENIFDGDVNISQLYIVASSTYNLDMNSSVIRGALIQNCSLFSFRSIQSGTFTSQYRLSSVGLYYCQYIDEFAFQDCPNLITFYAPTSEFSIIKTNLFRYCTRLSYLNIPYVLYVESYAFESNSYINDFNSPSASVIEEYAFHNCTNLQNVIVGPTCIGSHAFDGCIRLNMLNGPARLISIYEYALYNCSLYSGVFYFGTSTLEYIGSHAFDGCILLSNIQLTSISAPPILESIDAFDNIDSNYLVYIPSSISEQFVNHSVWGLISDHLMWTGKGE